MTREVPRPMVDEMTLGGANSPVRWFSARSRGSDLPRWWASRAWNPADRRTTAPPMLRRCVEVAGEERGQFLDRGFRAVALRGQYH
ncbi:hypothetical protein GA0115254_126827 [Streptomyces sp. Ncost-T10-10d]|nr:hypothetical protein GA0115254_126827 [Streptomyces sp. Ncost-T10-10d]